MPNTEFEKLKEYLLQEGFTVSTYRDYTYIAPTNYWSINRFSYLDACGKKYVYDSRSDLNKVIHSFSLKLYPKTNRIRYCVKPVAFCISDDADRLHTDLDLEDLKDLHVYELKKITEKEITHFKTIWTKYKDTLKSTIDEIKDRAVKIYKQLNKISEGIGELEKNLIKLGYETDTNGFFYASFSDKWLKKIKITDNLSLTGIISCRDFLKESELYEPIEYIPAFALINRGIPIWREGDTWGIFGSLSDMPD